MKRLLLVALLFLPACGDDERWRPAPIESQYDRTIVEERCDEIDNDHDGLVDETCECTPGDVQPCFAGPAPTRNRSHCRDGEQTCVDHFEFPQWGDCEGQVLPTPEECDNEIDDDCNGLVDEGCSPNLCWDPEFADEPGCGERCNGEDDNGDGRVDEARVCGDSTDGSAEPCTPNAVRLCDAYCGVHQKCGPGATWGPCIVDGYCVEVMDCESHGDCPRGNWCDFGICAPGTFTGEPCTSDDECFEWTCILDQGVCSFGCYHHGDCPPGLVCDLGSCLVDPYVPGLCP